MSNFQSVAKSRVDQFKIPYKVLRADLKKIGLNFSIPSIWRAVNQIHDKVDYRLYLGLKDILMIGEPSFLNHYSKLDFVLTFSGRDKL